VTNSTLYTQSIQIILANQAPSGAYVASPNFPNYRYCWYRDATYTAYAMDLVGQADSANRFYAWAAQAILAHADRAQRAVMLARQGAELDGKAVLHTRYTLDGKEAAGDEWPNFQLDGFGTWLWGLAEHARINPQGLTSEMKKAARLTADYLEALWRRPCFDCWEEFNNQIHPYTLAAIYGGLHAYTRLSGEDYQPTLEAIRIFVQTEAGRDGYFVKHLGTSMVDASLLGVAVPYRLVPPGDQRMAATVQRIAADLQNGGVHRYPEDTYYGGGEWVLLAGWLGWYYAETGQLTAAKELLEWIELQAAPDGSLPEQVPQHLIDPGSYQPWVARWGPIANPLLWSHAKYLILHHALQLA
jgi:GH15 family glucan-1,4-alpha-glucosidase